MYDFITDTAVIKVYQESITRYPDLSGIENDLTQAFRYYRYYFPTGKLPTIYTIYKLFWSWISDKYADSTLIIALDMYLGSDYKPYRELGLPLYRIRRLNKENIVNDCMHELANNQMVPPDESKTLLDEMIREGKILYFMMPCAPKRRMKLNWVYSATIKMVLC